MIVFISIPTVHILKTYFRENSTKPITPRGYTNDASGLNLTKVNTVVPVPSTADSIKTQLRSILAFAEQRNLPISIAGAQHTMGGHTMYPNGIILNMRPYKIMSLDTISNILTVGSGALWSDVIQYLDAYHRSVAVMQAFSSFSVGGSISVNGHGWQKDAPPVSSSMESLSLMTSEGQIVNCSRTENEELFHAVIGGYGLLGIILDVKLRVVPNESLYYKRYKIATSDYLTYFKRHASQNKDVKLVFGRLNVSHKNFLKDATLNTFYSAHQPVNPLPANNKKTSELKRLVFRSTVNSEYGKRLRWELETNLSEFLSEAIFTRNEILNEDATLIENKDSTSTDILQEYFIPERNFYSYIEALKTLLPNPDIDLLNITIRNVYKDHDSYLNYAREDVFGFVFLFNQKKDEKSEKVMRQLTQQMVEVAVKSEGTYYLPYRLHIDRNTMRKVYPQVDHFFKLKLKYDPQERFKNKFYEYYK